MRVDRTIQTFDCVSTKHFVTPMNIPNCYQYSIFYSFKVARYYYTSNLRAISIFFQFQFHLHERKANDFCTPKELILPFLLSFDDFHLKKNYDYCYGICFFLLSTVLPLK